MKKYFLSCICACIFLSSSAFADNNMRDYIAAPPDTLLSLLYYFNVRGDTLNVNGDKAADVDFDENLFLLREVYYFNLGSLLANAQVIIPFGRAEESDLLGDSSSGIGDIMLLGTIWLINNPENKTYLGFSPYFFLPTGEYDQNSGINLGANRWTFREELNLTQGIEILPGHDLYFEVTVGTDFYTTNTDYRNGADLKNDPLFNLESHISYDLTKEWVASVDYYGHWGGEAEINGEDVDDSDVNSQTLGATVAYNFMPGWQALLQYKQDVYNENCIETQIIQARIFYAFDLGSVSK